jgi:hypothetical protein
MDNHAIVVMEQHVVFLYYNNVLYLVQHQYHIYFYLHEYSQLQLKVMRYAESHSE